MKMNDFSAISYVNEPIVQREKQEVILSAEHISFQYEKNSPLILRDLTVSIEKGKWVALVGKMAQEVYTANDFSGITKSEKRESKVEWESDT